MKSKGKLKNLNRKSIKVIKLLLNAEKGKLISLNRCIDFDKRYLNKYHLITDLACKRDNHKEKIFLLEQELKRRLNKQEEYLK